MNKVVLLGRLTKDPELTFIPGSGTALTKATLAVSRYNTKTKQNEADFIPVQFWGKRAESVAKYTKKGSQLSISGKIRTGSYDAKDGTKRYTTHVEVDDFEFIGSKKDFENAETGTDTGVSSSGSNSSFSSGNNSSLINYDEDITPIDDSDMPF